MSEIDYVEVAAAMVVIIQLCAVEKKMKIRKLFWRNKWFVNRYKFSDIALLRTLRHEYPEDFKNYLKMCESNTRHLVSLMEPFIKKQVTRLMQPISAEERLATLRFLAPVLKI